MQQEEPKPQVVLVRVVRHLLFTAQRRG